MQFNPLNIPGVSDTPEWLSHNSAWIYHLPMVPVFLKLLQPRTFVELGTFRGDSYMMFCQSVAKLGLATQCTAVDTWEGDEHAGHYGPGIFQELQANHDPKYGKFSRLMKALFDTAVRAFPDNSIDLLHIDGLHTYEAVKHDYETWLPKMTDRGVILFHDTAILDRNFGVWKLWEEISKTKPSFNVTYGCGLGILAVGQNVPEEFLSFLSQLNTNQDRLLPLFFALGRRNELQRTWTTLSHILHDCQMMLNEWRRGTSQPIRSATPDLQRADADPVAFSKLVKQDVASTVTDAVRLLSEITELRKFKAAAMTPAIPA